MKLYLIRHAESANNHLAQTLSYDTYMEQRYAEPPLSERGLQQAEILGSYLAKERERYNFTHLYCSAMQRTLQTAQPFSQALGLQSEIWIDVHEHGGLFQGNPQQGGAIVNHTGLSRQEITERFPNAIIPAEVTENGWWYGGYEQWEDCCARAIRVATVLRERAKAEIEAGAKEEVLVVVSHGGFLSTLLKALLGQLPNRQVFYKHNNAGISGINFMPNGQLVMQCWNRTEHLPLELITE